MYRKDDEVHVSEAEASGGEKNHHVRYILGISLALVVVLMSLVWIVPAMMR